MHFHYFLVVFFVLMGSLSAVEEYDSPFLDEANQVPSYMLEVYKKVANPKRKVCQDRSFISIPNSESASTSICDSGKIKFSLFEKEEIGRFLHSSQVFIEIQSARASKVKIPRKIVVALSFVKNDTLLGYSTISENGYGAVDITLESRRWWANQEYDAPEMNVNFYIVQPKELSKSCTDLFWRSSVLGIWQDKPRCKKRLRTPRFQSFFNATHEYVDEVSTQEEMSESSEVDGENESFVTLTELEEALKESPGLLKLSERRKRAVHNNRENFDKMMDGQKSLFLHSLNKTSDKHHGGGFSNFLLERLLNSANNTNVISKAKKHFKKKSRTPRTSIKKKSRTPRKINKKALRKRECGLRKSVINFNNINWDWVIAPKQYSSGSCKGKCEFPLHSEHNPTNLAILNAIKRHVSGRGRYPCCVPDKMGSLTLLFKDSDGQTKVKHFEDMIVKSCRCM